MIRRYFRVKNFRNVGVEDFSKIQLNHILNSDSKMGDLVTLIGMNNTGKSNFLDAMIYMNTKKLKDNDIPIFNYEEDNSPIVSMWLFDDQEQVRYEYTYKNNTVYVDKYKNHEKVDMDSKSPILENGLYNESYIENVFKEYSNLLIEIKNISVDNTFKRYIDELIKNNVNKPQLEVIFNHINSSQFKRSLNRLKYSNQMDGLIEDLKKVLSDQAIKINKQILIENEIREKYNISFVPNIIRYDDSKRISDLDTILNISNGKVVDNDFYKLIFSYLDNLTYDNLKDVYTKFAETKKVYRHYLSNFQRQVNRELKKLSFKFNKVYGFEDQMKYSFNLVMESEKAYFILNEGDKVVPLDAQSTGFKWFFNFFFNVFANDKIGNGDIVILDEPATNLHVLGQQELRNQIKQFGLEHGITFVISTHSPFLIDVDYLDELRLVVKDGFESKIYNDFTVDFNGDNKADTLLPVYSALTVDKHILLDPNNTLVFVEGITDYNYLVAFKKLLGIENINFLPFQGTKSRNLLKIFATLSNKPVVLVDSDKAGNAFVNKYGENLEIHELKNVDDGWKEIEDLFSPQDQKTYYVNDKKSSLSSYFKNHIDILADNITKKTKDNFKALLNYLEI